MLPCRATSAWRGRSLFLPHPSTDSLHPKPLIGSDSRTSRIEPEVMSTPSCRALSQLSGRSADSAGRCGCLTCLHDSQDTVRADRSDWIELFRPLRLSHRQARPWACRDSVYRTTFRLAAMETILFPVFPNLYPPSSRGRGFHFTHDGMRPYHPQTGHRTGGV